MKALRLAILLLFPLLLKGSVTTNMLQVIAKKGAGGGSVDLAVHAVSSQKVTSASTNTFDHVITDALTDGLVIVGVAYHHWGAGTVTVTFDGDSMTAVGSAVNIDSENYVYLFQLAIGNKASGTYSVVATATTSPNVLAAGCISFEGVDQSTPVGTRATDATAWGAALSADVSSATGEIVVDVASNMNTQVLSVGSGQTERVNTLGLGMSTEPGATTTTMSWTLDGSTQAASIAVGVKPSS